MGGERSATARTREKLKLREKLLIHGRGTADSLVSLHRHGLRQIVSESESGQTRTAGQQPDLPSDVFDIALLAEHRLAQAYDICPGCTTHLIS
jgi:hypothetical protein